MYHCMISIAMQIYTRSVASQRTWFGDNHYIECVHRVTTQSLNSPSKCTQVMQLISYDLHGNRNHAVIYHSMSMLCYVCMHRTLYKNNSQLCTVLFHPHPNHHYVLTGILVQPLTVKSVGLSLIQFSLAFGR